MSNAFIIVLIALVVAWGVLEIISRQLSKKLAELEKEALGLAIEYIRLKGEIHLKGDELKRLTEETETKS